MCMLKGLCDSSGLSGSFCTQYQLPVLICNNSSKELEKLPVNDKITVSPQTNMSPKQYIKYYKQQN